MENSQIIRNTNPHKYYLIIGLIISIISIVIIIIYIYYQINLIKIDFSGLEHSLLIKARLLKKFFHIFNIFNILILLLDSIFIMFLSYESNYLIQLYFEKNINAFIYFNYLFFGPFLFGVVILCMKYGNEITFIYNEKTKKLLVWIMEIFLLSFYIFLFLLLLLLLGLFIILSLILMILLNLKDMETIC